MKELGQAPVLFITLSNIGDAVLTTPALRMLHAAMPDNAIDILCDARSQDLFTHCPWRGELLIRDKRAGFMRSAKQLFFLRARRYELVVDLRTDGIGRLLGARRCLDKRSAIYEGVHAVQSHISVVRPLSPFAAEIPSPQIWLADQHRQWWLQHSEQFRDACYLAIAPGANWPGKIWPTMNYVELANQLSSRFDALVLLGDERDQGAGQTIEQHSRLPVVNLLGRTDLLQAGAVLERACAFVGNDSGLGHIASAMSCPTLTIFGPGRPARYRPWGPLCDWVRASDQALTSVDVDSALTRLSALVERAPAVNGAPA